MAVLRRTPVRLLGIGLAFAMVIIYILMFPSKTDSQWWKHVGLPSQVKPQHRPTPFTIKNLGIGAHDSAARMARATDGSTTRASNDPLVNDVLAPAATVRALKTHPQTKSAEEILASLAPGVDYFADYDVSQVKIAPDPPLKPGARRYFSYMNQAESKYNFLWMSNSPRVAYVPEFLTDEEADYMRNTAAKSLRRSQVAVYNRDKSASPINDVRTSTQTWLQLSDPVVKRVSERIFDLTGFPEGSSEMMQVLRYDIGQKYDAHNDYFDPKLYGAQHSNRAVTVFLYLEDTEEGGETQFPDADGKSLTYDYKSCNRGLRVKPKKRAVTVFYDMKPDGSLDPWSLHGGCPVRKGVKWGGTLWLRVAHGGH